MATKKKVRKQIQAYAFVDTNIYLDFYRAGNEANLKLLERLKPVKDRIICTYQVEMEFLKNRQSEILKSIRALKNHQGPILPAILADSAVSKTLKEKTKEANQKTERLKARLKGLMENPNQNDQVFQVLEEIFHSESDHVLTRDMPIRHVIKRRAWRRFILGYPPRKSNDTSIGDALNWEWMIHCANRLPGKFIIVSRDSDFGSMFSDEYYLNDQLYREFRDRVGKKSIEYTHKLSAALKRLNVTVPKEELEAEEESLKETRQRDSDSKHSKDQTLDEILKELLGEDFEL